MSAHGSCATHQDGTAFELTGRHTIVVVAENCLDAAKPEP